MNLPSWHIHVSERQPGAWVDCTPDSAVEFARLCHDKSIPATHAEGDAIRTASGRVTTGGLNIDNIITAFKVRYKWTTGFHKVSGFSALWSFLKPGTAAVVQGSMVAFPPASTYSRFDPTFDGGHAVCVLRLDATDRVWWCDPEAPTGSYKGEWMSKSDLAKFVNAFGGSHLVADILGAVAPAAPEPGMPALKTSLPGYTSTVEKDVNVRPTPTLTSTPVRLTTAPEKWSIVGIVTGDAAGPVGAKSTDWLCRWGPKGWEYATVTHATAPVAPSTDSTAEVAKLSAEVNTLTASNTALAAERDDAKARLDKTLANIDALKG